MKKEDIDVSGGWIDLKKLLRFLSERNIKELCRGPRDNQTGGEWHCFFIRLSDVFESHGNGYDSKTFIPLIEWADKYSLQKNKIMSINPDDFEIDSFRDGGLVLTCGKGGMETDLVFTCGKDGTKETDLVFAEGATEGDPILEKQREILEFIVNKVKGKI